MYNCIFMRLCMHNCIFIRGSNVRMRYQDYFYNRYLDGRNFKLFNVWDKEDIKAFHIFSILNKTIAMFKYNRLPDTMNVRNLELLLQTQGFCGINEVQSKNPRYPSGLYALYGTLGGEPDPDYMPSQFVCANAGLNISASWRINEECSIVRSDRLYLGVLPVADFYSQTISESYMSLLIELVNMRATDILTAPDDDIYIAAKEFIEQIKRGEIGVIKDQRFEELGQLRRIAGNDLRGRLTDIIEAIQFNRSNLYNECGLQSNFNMKRESLNSAEVALNNDTLYPIVENMLECRQEDFKRVNEMFGTNITVELNTSWKYNLEEVKQELKSIKDSSNVRTENEEEPEKEEDEENADKT